MSPPAYPVPNSTLIPELRLQRHPEGGTSTRDIHSYTQALNGQPHCKCQVTSSRPIVSRTPCLRPSLVCNLQCLANCYMLSTGSNLAVTSNPRLPFRWSAKVSRHIHLLSSDARRKEWRLPYEQVSGKHLRSSYLLAANQFACTDHACSASGARGIRFDRTILDVGCSSQG